MKRTSRIIVAISMRVTSNREYMHGISAFARERGAWTCDFKTVDGANMSAIREANGVEGLIVHIANRRIAAAVARVKVPVVAVGFRTPRNAAGIHVDTEATARLVLEHFTERGLRHFAFSANDVQMRSAMLGEAFRGAVEEQGYSYEELWTDNHRQTLTRWLKKLPKPVGLFVSDDDWALKVATACRNAGIKVPIDVAIVGVGNDDTLCTLCDPQLSSVDPNARQAGFEAAKMMNRLLNGETVPAEPLLVKPERVVVRESSDVVSADDERVTAATRYIYDHLEEGINVKQLVQRLDIGRRTLERAFVRHLGRTVHDEIARAQVQRAQRLLEDGHMPLMQVALKCGLRRRSQLNDFFKKHTGMTPLKYRQRHQWKL